MYEGVVESSIGSQGAAAVDAVTFINTAALAPWQGGGRKVKPFKRIMKGRP